MILRKRFNGVVLLLTSFGVVVLVVDVYHLISIAYKSNDMQPEPYINLLCSLKKTCVITVNIKN